MKSKSKIKQPQIAKIKIAAKSLGLDDNEYRNVLSQFTSNKGEPVKSCTELTEEQADILINSFVKAGWKPKYPPQRQKYAEFDGRLGSRANGAQMRKIEAMWMEKARVKTESAMNDFIFKITKRSHISFLLKKDVSKMVEAIENLK
jgi:phage gp16-like protein